MHPLVRLRIDIHSYAKNTNWNYLPLVLQRTIELSYRSFACSTGL